MAEQLEREMEQEIPSLTECLTQIGWKHQVKIVCSACGQKLDMTEIAPFAAVCCPRCAGRVVRPVYFGSYVLEDQGRKRDSMTTVFRAYDGKLGRYVSLKILNPEYSASEGTRSRFTKIARLLAAINHPAIIPVYDCGERNGLAYIVSQYAEYGTLKEFLALQTSPLPTEMVLQWGHDLVSGIRKAFSSGLSHGEINPANILVDSEKRVRLTGFGLSELMREAGIRGSEMYAAPEKTAEGIIDEKGDVYSLGILFFRLMTGKEPSAEGGPERGELPQLSGMSREINRKLSDLVRRMVSRLPEERPDLSQILETLDLSMAALESSQKERRRNKISTKLQYDGKMTKTSVGNDGSGNGWKKWAVLIFSLLLLLGLAVFLLLLMQ